MMRVVTRGLLKKARGGKDLEEMMEVVGVLGWLRPGSRD
jgi:hypothetical protein